MKVSVFSLLVLVGLAILPIPASAQDRQSDINRLARTGNLNGGELAANDSNRAGESMVELATELQALYDLGGSTERDAGIREEIVTRSAALGSAVVDLIGYINRVSSPPEETEPIDIPEENYDARSLRLVTTYLDLVDSLTVFVNGDRIEGEEADRLRLGLETMGALAAAIPKTEF